MTTAQWLPYLSLSAFALVIIYLFIVILIDRRRKRKREEKLPSAVPANLRKRQFISFSTADYELEN